MGNFWSISAILGHFWANLGNLCHLWAILGNFMSFFATLPNKDPILQTDHVTSQDPILTAFELSWELRQLAFSEFEFKSEYLVRAQLYTLTSTMMRSFSFQDIELFTILVRLFVSIY